jgi:hypothetical protein
MGLGHSPRIITDGLVLALDAANPKNYNLTAVEVLVVAGGGSGGVDNGGGGGAGGLIYNSNFTVTPGSALTVTVGSGGAARSGASDDGPGNNGGNSVFGSLTAYGGGGGSGWTNTTLPPGSSAYTGGSGAGQSASTGSGNSLGAGTGNRVTGTTTVAAGQGNNGGTAVGAYGGGGGGAGGPGGNASSGNAGAGGLGFRSNISGTEVIYAAGGAGGWDVINGYTSTLPFTENGTVKKTTQTTEDACPANTGHGGNGGNHNNNTSGAGGSGIVIVRYPGPQKAIGGTVTSVGGHTIHTFTTVGSTTFTPLVATNNSAILGLADFSGNNNFGKAENSPTYSSSNGGYITFDGVNEYVNIGVGKGVNQFSGDFTLSAWVMRLSGGPTYGNIFGDYYTGSVATTNEWQLMMGNTTPAFHFYRVGSNYVISATPAGYDLNIWYNVVISRIGSTITMYANGNSIATTTNSTVFGTATGNFNIGIDGNNASEPFSGRIANVMIYKNKGLTAAEVQQNFNALRGRFGI